MQIKMQQLAYIRKLQFKMQNEPEAVLAWYEKNSTEDLILKNFVDNEDGTNNGLVSFYGAAIEELNETLPIERIVDMLKEFKTIKKEEGKLTKEDEEGREKNKRKMDKLVQLEPVDNLKNGVVANMVGVIAFLLEKYNYQVYISLEDLSKPFSSKIISGIDATTGEGEDAAMLKICRTRLYNFFMQLLKTFPHSTGQRIFLHLVRSELENYAYSRCGKVKNHLVLCFADAELLKPVRAAVRLIKNQTKKIILMLNKQG